MKKNLLLISLLFYCFCTNAQNVGITIDTPLPVCNPGDCVDLQANYLITKPTGTYTVAPITYAPFFPFTGGTLITTTNSDDIWSAGFNLPFPFCFYGQNFTTVLIGSNGVLHFADGSEPAGGFCDWNYSTPIPNTAFPIKNAVYGVYQDTDIRTPPVTNPAVQNVNFYVTGTAPNRVFIANFNELPQFLCASSVGLQTSQIILYETTNVIEVLVNKRTSCTTWSNPNGVIGVMNSAGTQAVVPALRNTGTWSASNEAWRFTPAQAGPPNVVLTWLENGTPIPGSTNVNPLNVCPTASTIYTAVATYTRCDGTTTVVQDTETVAPEAPLPVLDPQDIFICTASPGPHTFNINQNAYMLNGLSATDYTFTYHVDNAGVPGAVIPNATLGAYTPASSVYPQTIWVVIEDQNTTACTNLRSFILDVGAAPSGTFSYPGSPYCSDDSTPHLPALSGLTPGGTYSYVVTPPGPGTLILDTTTGAITPNGSTFNTTYTVSYDVPLSGSCPAYHTEATVTIAFCVTCTTVASNSGPICAGSTFDLFATNAGAGATYSWTGPNMFASTDQNPVGVPSPTGAGPYVYTVTATIGGIPCSSSSTTLTVNPIPAAPTVTTPVTYCQNATATALTATGTGLLWYTVPTGGTGSAAAPTPSTVTPGTTTYYVSQTISGCESPRASIDVTVTATPAAPTVTTPVTYCQNAPATALTATGTNLLWYTVATGGTGSATAPIPSTATPGTTTYYVSQTVSGCEGSRASITVNITATPAAPTVTTPVTYCQNATATALTATGTALLWYTVATGGTGSTTAPTPITTTAGTTTYYVSQTVSGCESPRASIVVNVNATPALPGVTTPVTYCQNATATALTATGTGLLWYTVPTGGTGSAAAPTPSTVTPGTTTYYVSQTILTCEGPRASINVTVTATPAAPTVTTPVTYCQNVTATALTATGTALLWYTVATGGTGSATAPIPSTVTPGTTTYYVSQTVSGCEGSRASIAVNITATPAAPTVTTPVTYCQNATATALTATGTALLWYTVVTGGTGSTTAPTPITTTAGTTTYYVSQTVSGCESPRAGIVVNVNATPALPGVTTPVTYCQNATATALTATGTGLLWYTVPTGGTGSAAAPTPSTVTPGTTTYYVSQTILTCEGPRASINVTVTATPAAPTVTTPVTYCQNATATALTATGTALLWYTVATGGTGSATAPIPSTATPGTTTYYVSQTVSGCEGPRASIAVNITATPAAPTVTTPVTYCQNAMATALTATGTALLWYTVATGGTGSTTAPTPITTTAGTTTYYVSQTVSGCESPRASIVVNVNATPALPGVTTPVTYCQNATATALTATGTGLLWYTVPTGGTGSAAAPTPSTVTPGTTTYYVSQTILTCEGPRASINVTVTATPAAPTVTTPVTYCQNATATALTATGTALLWYTVATGGTGSATAPIPSTATPGTTTYYVSQTVSGCEGPRASIAVNITATPAAPTVTTPVAYCQNATATALTATGTALLWYTVATGGTGSTTAPTPITTTAGTTTYYVSQTVSGCESPRASIVVNVVAPPVAPGVTTPVAYCQNATATALTATGTGLLWYTVPTGGTGSATAPTPSTAGIGTVTYYVSQTVSGCEGPRASIAVNVTATPAAPTVTTPVTYCQNETPIALTAAGTNLLWYTTATGGTGSTIAPIPGTSASGTTTYYVSQTTSGCESPRASISVIVNGLPNPSLIDGYICLDNLTGLPITTYTLNAGLDDVNYDFEWYNTTTVPATLIAGQNQNEYVATTSGTYEVIAINLATGCRSEVGHAEATVGTSSAPQSIVVVPSNYFAEVQTITVNATPAGNYEYQIDNGGFQSSNVFTNVGSGSHNIEVRDVNQCGLLLGQTFIVDFPHFFTPNGDGYHDTWNISALSNQSNAKILIFDRFGKLLKQIMPSDDGWNGTFNQQELPSTDYWFIVYYDEDGVSKEFRSHFAMKR